MTMKCLILLSALLAGFRFASADIPINASPVPANPDRAGPPPPANPGFSCTSLHPADANSLQTPVQSFNRDNNVTNTAVTTYLYSGCNEIFASNQTVVQLCSKYYPDQYPAQVTIPAKQVMAGINSLKLNCPHLGVNGGPSTVGGTINIGNGTKAFINPWHPGDPGPIAMWIGVGAPA